MMTDCCRDGWRRHRLCGCALAPVSCSLLTWRETSGLRTLCAISSDVPLSRSIGSWVPWGRRAFPVDGMMPVCLARASCDSWRKSNPERFRRVFVVSLRACLFGVTLRAAPCWWRHFSHLCGVATGRAFLAVLRTAGKDIEIARPQMLSAAALRTTLVCSKSGL